MALLRRYIPAAVLAGGLFTVVFALVGEAASPSFAVSGRELSGGDDELLHNRGEWRAGRKPVSYRPGKSSGPAERNPDETPRPALLRAWPENQLRPPPPRAGLSELPYEPTVLGQGPVEAPQEGLSGGGQPFTPPGGQPFSPPGGQPFPSPAGPPFGSAGG